MLLHVQQQQALTERHADTWLLEQTKPLTRVCLYQLATDHPDIQRWV